MCLFLPTQLNQNLISLTTLTIHSPIFDAFRCTHLQCMSSQVPASLICIFNYPILITNGLLLIQKALRSHPVIHFKATEHVWGVLLTASNQLGSIFLNLNTSVWFWQQQQLVLWLWLGWLCHCLLDFFCHFLKFTVPSLLQKCRLLSSVGFPVYNMKFVNETMICN